MSTRVLTPKEEARAFFFTLYRDAPQEGEWFELRCLDCSQTPALPGPRLYVRSLTVLIDKAIELRDQWDVFYGVGFRRCTATHQMEKCPHKTRGLDHIARLPAAWVDVDVQSPDEPNKRYPTLADALEAVYELPVPPKLIVMSGAGLHVYWPMPKPTTDLDRVAAFNQKLAARLEVDNCGDAPRILRVPGTFNRKHGRPLPVRLLEAPEDSL
jgi:hypothetical protein